MAVKTRRDPVIVAPDQLPPDEWIIGDKMLMSLGGVMYVLTVNSKEPRQGLDWTPTKNTSSCDSQLAAYYGRLKMRTTPEETRINAIWDAIEEFSKQ